MTNRVLTADLPSAVAEKLYATATKLDRSTSSVVTEAVTTWLDLEERRHLRTLEGLADVDAGRLVAQDIVEAWAAGLDGDQPVTAAD